MLTSSVLVLLMTIPGLALFYGGLVRSKNMLSVLMHVFYTVCVVVVIWAIYGYSLTFTGGSSIIGGLDKIFLAAGFEWREPGCSMCLAMNPDKLAPGERSASTSNRNFEGRQGPGVRTHLASPVTVAASALAGRIADPRPLLARE